MPREADPSLNERQFVLQALRENLRLDGRPFDKYRPVELTFGEQYGVVEVSFGKTKSASLHAGNIHNTLTTAES